MYNTPLLQRFQEQPSALENQRPEWIQLVFKWPEKQATYIFLHVNPLQEGEKDAFQPASLRVEDDTGSLSCINSFSLTWVVLTSFNNNGTDHWQDSRWGRKGVGEGAGAKELCPHCFQIHQFIFFLQNGKSPTWRKWKWALIDISKSR